MTSHLACSVQTVVDTLTAGDYALHIDPSIAAVERKGLADFVKCCSGQDRQRMFKQASMLRGSVDRPLLIIEGADYTHLEMGGWRGQLTPEAVLATLHTIQNLVPVMLCRSRNEAARAVFRHLRLAMLDRYKRCREFARVLQKPQ